MFCFTKKLPVHFMIRNKPRQEGFMKTIKITGMTCNHCVMAVTKTLSGIDGVKNVKVDLKSGEATFDEAKPVDMKVVKERIQKAGYEVAWKISPDNYNLCWRHDVCGLCAPRGDSIKRGQRCNRRGG
jgi:copper chaperone